MGMNDLLYNTALLLIQVKSALVQVLLWVLLAAAALSACIISSGPSSEFYARPLTSVASDFPLRMRVVSRRRLGDKTSRSLQDAAQSAPRKMRSGQSFTWRGPGVLATLLLWLSLLQTLRGQLDTADKQALLDLHNELRGSVGGANILQSVSVGLRGSLTSACVASCTCTGGPCVQ